MDVLYEQIELGVHSRTRTCALTHTHAHTTTHIYFLRGTDVMRQSDSPVTHAQPPSLHLHTSIAEEYAIRHPVDSKKPLKATLSSLDTSSETQQKQHSHPTEIIREAVLSVQNFMH